MIQLLHDVRYNYMSTQINIVYHAEMPQVLEVTDISIDIGFTLKTLIWIIAIFIHNLHLDDSQLLHDV